MLPGQPVRDASSPERDAGRKSHALVAVARRQFFIGAAGRDTYAFSEHEKENRGAARAPATIAPSGPSLTPLKVAAAATSAKVEVIARPRQ